MSTVEEARTVIDRLAEELGLAHTDNKGWIKIVCPGTGHKVYVQKTKDLRQIHCSLDLEAEEVGHETFRLPPKGQGGAVKCHIVPTLSNLERALRMIADPSVGQREVNRPRPFAPTRQAVHRPKPVTQPIPEDALEAVPEVEGQTLGDRLAELKRRGRLARARKRVETDLTGRMTMDLALAIEEGRVNEEDVLHVPDLAAREVQEALESGVEIEGVGP